MIKHTNIDIVNEEDIYYVKSVVNNSYCGDIKILDFLKDLNKEIKDTKTINKYSFIIGRDNITKIVLSNYSINLTDSFDIYINSMQLANNLDFYKLDDNILYFNMKLNKNDIVIIHTFNNDLEKENIIKYKNNYEEKEKINNIYNKINDVISILKDGENIESK